MLNVSVILKGKDLPSLNWCKVERYNVDAAMETIESILPHESISMCVCIQVMHSAFLYFQNADLPTFHLETTPTEKIFSEYIVSRKFYAYYIMVKSLFSMTRRS